jgi:hypothetical protein
MQDELHRFETEVTAALVGLDARQTQATPLDRPEKWSIQQVVEHLMKTYLGTIPAIEARIDKRSGTRARPTLRQRYQQFWFLNLGRCPYGRTAPPASSPSSPTTVRSGSDLAQRISTELVRLDRVTTRGEQIFADRRAVTHLMLGPLSMDQWRRFHVVHGRHHLKQIWAIRKEHGF